MDKQKIAMLPSTTLDPRLSHGYQCGVTVICGFLHHCSSKEASKEASWTPSLNTENCICNQCKSMINFYA